MNDDALPWASPRVGVPVERRDSWELAMHGARAGLLAGVALGVVEITASAILSDDPWLPFDFAGGDYHRTGGARTDVPAYRGSGVGECAVSKSSVPLPSSSVPSHRACAVRVGISIPSISHLIR